MARIWQLQEARNRLGEVIEQALRHGPQVITKRGKEIAVVLSCEEYWKLLLHQRKLSDFFRESPLTEAELDLTRDHSPVRDDISA
jgi:prevent-host-death family protein